MCGVRHEFRQTHANSAIECAPQRMVWLGMQDSAEPVKTTLAKKHCLQSSASAPAPRATGGEVPLCN